ncbi:MAG: hypothetical protein HY823_13320 [Acidobacteria bacterium]|nr:hypothetical protein [Acidobacteriota bacterium]
MLSHLSLAALLWIPRGPSGSTDLRPVMDRFERECLGRGGAACAQLQAQLERALYDDLMTMELGGKSPDRRLLRVAARAELPELAAFGLRRLARRSSPEDAPLALAGLENPCAAVRAAASDLARSLNDPQLRRLNARRGNLGGDSKSGLVPTRVPGAAELAGAPYPGAAYSYATSRKDLAIFRTGDPPDRVIAGLRGKRVLSASEIKALKPPKGGKAQDEAMAAEMMQAMMSGKDPQKLVQEMQTRAQAQNVDWTRGIEGAEGVANVRYVVLEETSQKLPVKVVAVFRDEALGATGLAYHLTPQSPGYAMAAKGGKVDAAYLQALQQLQMRRD